MWTNQQAAESLSTIDKRTINYLGQIFGKIDNLPSDMAYGDVDQSVSYQDLDQDYAAYPLQQLQSGYEGEVLAGVNGPIWTSAPDGFE